MAEETLPFLDLDAFVRRPRGVIEVRGVKHPVYHPTDLTWREYLKLTRIAAELESRPGVSRLARWFPTFLRIWSIVRRWPAEVDPAEYSKIRKMADQIVMLVPSLTRRQVMRLTLGEIGAITVWIQKFAAEEAGRPLGERPKAQ